jgi:hypothetical protein
VKKKNGKKTLQEKKVEDRHEFDDLGVENNQTGNPIMRSGRLKVAM